MKLPAGELYRWAAIAALGLTCAGCGGINASHSVSPASFFLPGLMKADPPKEPSDQPLPATPVPKELAQAR